jgi:hypothetical protein
MGSMPGIPAGCEFSRYAWTVNLVMDGESKRFLFVNEDEISLPSRVRPIGRTVINSHVQHTAYQQRKVAGIRRLKRIVRSPRPGVHSEPHTEVNTSDSYPERSLVRQNTLSARDFPVQLLPRKEQLVQRHKASSSLKRQLVAGSMSRDCPPHLSSQIGGLRVDPFHTYPIESKGCVPGAIDYCTISLPLPF